MNTKAILAIAAFAAVASTGVRADEADASQYAVKFEGTRTRAEVKAEAATVSATRSNEPAGSRVAAPMKSTWTRRWCAQKPPKRFAWAKPPAVKSATCKPCAPKQTTPLPGRLFCCGSRTLYASKRTIQRAFGKAGTLAAQVCPVLSWLPAVTLASHWNGRPTSFVLTFAPGQETGARKRRHEWQTSMFSFTVPGILGQLLEPVARYIREWVTSSTARHGGNGPGR